MKFLKAYFSTVNIQIISNAEQANYFHEISQTVQTERYLADEMIITHRTLSSISVMSIETLPTLEIALLFTLYIFSPTISHRLEEAINYKIL